VKTLEEKVEALIRYVETLKMMFYAETGAIPSGVGFVEGGALKYYRDEELGLPRDVFVKTHRTARSIRALSLIPVFSV
jgi:hypothetical protein